MLLAVQKKKVIQMIVKFTVISFFSFLLFACSENKEMKEREQSSFEKKLLKYEEFIPTAFLSHKNLFLWRIGSIQWSSDATLFILLYDSVSNSYKNCLYLQFNEEIENSDIKVTMHQFSINRSNINLLNHEKTTIDYRIHEGEGYCSNQYFFKSPQSDFMILVNGNKKLINQVLPFVKCISQKEHFQSYSLVENCCSNDSVSAMILNKNDNNYILPFDKPIKFNEVD